MSVTVWGYRDKGKIIRHFAALLRGLGYDASARVFPDCSSYKSAIASPEAAQIGIEGFAADSATPSNFTPSFVCSPPSYRPNNLSQFCDRRIAAQIGEARGARGVEADALWERIYRGLGRAAPAVPLLNRRTVTLVSRRVGNYQEHPLWGPLLDQLWVR
jgi:ABC-type transport system substrate-binding protein